jgi:hypothetical protein
MLHVATVHHASPRWIEIQTSYMRKSFSVPYQTWTSLEKIDPSYGKHFDHVLVQKGMHAAKLNNLAMEICDVAEDDDWIMFFDGDAFPIADPIPLVRQCLAKAPLAAVRRAENADEPQPHPCFCFTTAGVWRGLPGDWTAGYTWPGAHGTPTSDVGGNLLRRLEMTSTPWEQIYRTNRHDVDPLYQGIYGDVVYHHGAGLTGGLSPAHRAKSPEQMKLAALPGSKVAERAINGLRWRRWERAEEARIKNLSDSFYAKIAAGDDAWLKELM